VQSPRAPAVAANVAASPRAPAVAAKAQAPVEQGMARRWEDEPASDGWESADTVNSFPEPTDLPAPPPRAMPAVQAQPPGPPATQASPATSAPGTGVPATPVSPGTMRGPYPTSPGIGEGAPVAVAAAAPPAVPTGASAGAAGVGARGGVGPTGAARAATANPATAAHAGLGSAMREEVWAIVRAAVEEAMGPMVARVRELEARLERAERGGNTSGAGRSGSIPVAFGPSVAPPAFAAKSPVGLPSFDNDPTAVTHQAGATIPDVKAAGRGPMLSLPPQGYGVTVMQSTRPTLDLDAVGAVSIEGFDGGRRKRRVAGAVVAIMLMIIIGAVTMTVISQS
jgi:hypothetical protein